MFSNLRRTPRLHADATGRSPAWTRRVFRLAGRSPIDHAVLEKHDRVAVVEFPRIWSDLGSWDSVAGHSRDATLGNRATGDARFEGCRNVFVHGGDRLTVAIGLEDILVVDTPDALLISSRGSAESLKTVVADPRKQRSGPRFRTIGKSTGRGGRTNGSVPGENFEVRRLVLKPGARNLGALSSPPHRALGCRFRNRTRNMWRSRVPASGQRKRLVPAGTMHSLENPGQLPLEIVETLSGSYFGEDDVIRPTEARIEADMEELG